MVACLAPANSNADLAQRLLLTGGHYWNAGIFLVHGDTRIRGAKLNLRIHDRRAGQLMVISGSTKVTWGKETFLLAENQSSCISLGTLHQLENPGRAPLEMIELQSGSYQEEHNIVRLEDSYGRVPSTDAKKTKP